MNQDQVDKIAESLNAFGLKGQWWLLSIDDELRQQLAASAPNREIIPAPPPEKADLKACSIMLVDHGADQSAGEDSDSQAIGVLFARGKARPLVALLPGAQDGAVEQQLNLSGYGEPFEIDCDGLNLQVFEHTQQDHKRHFDVAGYWEQRYRSGRNSGAGSYGRLARFKARFLNQFVDEFGIQSVVELGCGDGAQLSLADYPRYYGLDISPTVVAECQSRFADESSKSFAVYRPESFDPSDYRGDLALSLDVIYHLSNDDTYQSYLEHLFASAKRFVIIYSNSDVAGLAGVNESAGYIRFRDFLQDVKVGCPGWQLVSATPNRYPYSALNPGETSFADFYVFKKSTSKEESSRDTSEILDRMVIHKAFNALTMADENLKSLDSALAGNEELLRSLDRRVVELARTSRDSESDVDVKLRRISESIDAANEGSLNVLEEIQRQIARIEVAHTEQVEQKIDQLLIDLENKQKEIDKLSAAYYEIKDQVVPELERELSESRVLQEQLDEVASRLSATCDELDRTKRLEIPGLKRLTEIERHAADRTVQNLKSSLTWQIGTCFREATGSFQGLIRLPVRVLRVLRGPGRARSERHPQCGPRCLIEPRLAPDSWIELGNAPNWLHVKLGSTRELEVSGKIALEPMGGAIERCGLVRIEYLDSESRVIAGQHKGVNFSRQVGHYKYLCWNKDEKGELFRLCPPEGARVVRLGFQAWHCPARLRIANEIRLSPVARTKRAPVRKFQPPSTEEQELSILGWPEPPETEQPLILSVIDEFTEGCLESDLRLVRPRPDNWYALAKEYPPVAVFVESAWKGNGGSWQYRIGSYSIKPGHELEDMMMWASEAGIPSIFWNKEDPVHHEKFMDAASMSDHIFTTDENMVESYRKRLGHESVHALPFAAQPALHKPAPLDERIGKCCFAGSWYGDRHVERGNAMKWLLGAALKRGLDIFDRNHGTGNFSFPEKYHHGIRGALPYRELCREYGRYRVFLNVNSVTDSPTMFSRRVFELMACGTPVVSTYAKGIEQMLGSDSVWLVRNEVEADEAIHTLLTDDAEWRRRSLAGIREVFSRHTYAHRINQIFEVAGVGDRLDTEPQVVLVSQPRSQRDLEGVLAFAQDQEYRSFRVFVEYSKPKEMHRFPESVELVQPGELASRIEEAKNGASAMGWIDGRNNYGRHYVQDLANAMKYQPEASGWAKSCNADMFRFGEATSLMASIWRPEVFTDRYMMGKPFGVADNELFVADADEFSLCSRESSQAGSSDG